MSNLYLTKRCPRRRNLHPRSEKSIKESSLKMTKRCQNPRNRIGNSLKIPKSQHPRNGNNLKTLMSPQLGRKNRSNRMMKKCQHRRSKSVSNQKKTPHPRSIRSPRNQPKTGTKVLPLSSSRRSRKYSNNRAAVTMYSRPSNLANEITRKLKCLRRPSIRRSSASIRALKVKKRSGNPHLRSIKSKDRGAHLIVGRVRSRSSVVSSKAHQRRSPSQKSTAKS